MMQNIFVILWKDFLKRKNHYLQTGFEFFIPVGIIILANVLLPARLPEINNDPIFFEKFKVNGCKSIRGYYDTILFEPSTNFTEELMSKAACYAGYKRASVQSGRLDKNDSNFAIGIKFDVSEFDSDIPKNLNYTIYPKHDVWMYMDKLWRTSEYVPRYSVPLLRNVIEIQRAIDTSYIYLKNITAPMLNMENTDFYDRSPRIFSVAISFAFFLGISLMVPPVISRIIEEKSGGAKEMMLIMGVKKLELWLAKFLDSFLFQAFTLSGMILFMYVPLKESSTTLTVSPLIMWSVILYGSISVVLFLFFLSCFFKKARIAVYVAEVIWICSFILNKFLPSLAELSIFVKYLMCLFPHITLMSGLSVLQDFDYYGKEVKLTEILSTNNSYLTLLEILIFMSLNIVIYSVLTWYLDQVMPGQYGVPKPYGFCFKKSYWISHKSDTSVNNNFISNGVSTPPAFEPVPETLKKGIHIENVSKVFKSLDKGPLTAVDNVSIDFYHSEISALLGHNGAGKTTMFSMITGLIHPSAGRILINDYDLALNINEARRSLGLCPQEDMLFHDLTVLQILKFYGVIKGLTFKEATTEANTFIEKLKLNEVKTTQTKDLSGGQKRKVSLAIALIGGSQVLILDEPTSGMDPEIRREIWEILLGLRGSRTILITTHFMEEADVLCDRIAIMDSGKIKCYGSPMFLKSKYGRGYILSIVLPEIGHYKDISDVITEFIPMAKFKSQNLRTVLYELPDSEIDKFPLLFSELDKKQTQNEIISYGVSVTSLEDVFLKLRSKNDTVDDFDTTDSAQYIKFLNGQNSVMPRVSNTYFYFYQFWSLLIKNWIIFKRQFKVFILYSVMGGVIVALTTLLSNSPNNGEKQISLHARLPIPFSTNLYSPFLVLYSNSENSTIDNVFPNFIKDLNCDIRKVTDVKQEIYNIYKKDFYEYARKMNLGVKFSPNVTTLYHNDMAPHMIPVALNLIHNFLMRVNNMTESITTALNIKFATKDQFVRPPTTPQCYLGSIPDFSGLQTLFYFLGPLKEVVFGAKDLQLMITPAVLYWLSFLIIDLISFIVYMVCMCLWFGFTQGSTYLLENGDEVFGGLVLWGIGMILVAYNLAVLIKTEAGVFAASAVIYVLFTFVFNNPISTFGLPDFIQYLHPTSMLKNAFSNLCVGESGGYYIMALFIYDLVLFGILVVLDSKILPQIIQSVVNKLKTVNYETQSNEDDLVKQEKAVVDNIVRGKQTSRFALVVSDLKKWYLKSFRLQPCVRGISFAVKEGECFGLLGVNGAGKTSTFKMLTGAMPSSGGMTFIHSEHLTLFNRQKYLFQIGYCPQYGGLIPSFKGSEMLKLFAGLRGIKRSHARMEVSDWLEKLHLTNFSGQKCGTFSGGNQRKLSVAISLIGDSRLIFLDEPTSGVDPASRRLMWNVIDEVQKQNRSVVLTSHCMDECEALCSRLAIMVKGRFRCLGETTTLKKNYGQGYCVQLKVSSNALAENVQSFKQAFAAAFDFECTLIDEHLTILQYQVAKKAASWATLFSKLKILKDDFKILESYSASETTLEQIFIYMARNQ